MCGVAVREPMPLLQPCSCVSCELLRGGLGLAEISLNLVTEQELRSMSGSCRAVMKQTASLWLSSPPCCISSQANSSEMSLNPWQGWTQLHPATSASHPKSASS